MKLNYSYLKYSRFLLHLVIVLHFLGCEKNLNNYSDFNKYCKFINIDLNEKHNNKTVFLIYGTHSCNSCIDFALNKLDSGLTSAQKKSMYFDFIGGKTFDSISIKTKYPDILYYVDKKELFYSKSFFNIKTTAPHVLFIENNRITHIIELLPRNKESVISLICNFLN